MVRVHTNTPKVDPTLGAVDFDPESVEYYPSSCCEMLHVRNAVLASTVLQIFFCTLLGFLYLYLDSNGFLRAVDVCRMSMILLFVCSAIGLLCAFFGILQEKISLIHCQTMILTCLVVIADLMALCLVLIMAIGKRNYTTASIPGVFIDTDRVEYILGPFWIYLVAIMLHMTAAATMCLIGVYNRYLKFLKSKNPITDYVYNSYYDTVHIPIHRERFPEKKQSIAVIVVVDKLSRLPNYALAQDSIECYCKHFDYPLIRVFADQEKEWTEQCPMEDFMFQRHCIVRLLMIQNPQYRYFFFFDADIGVINPNKLLEDYINPRSKIILNDRIFNFEIMAGSYIVQNTDFAKDFLKDWAEYNYKLPDSFHGSDNAAIHQVLLERYNPAKTKICRLYWEASVIGHGLYDYSACVRRHLGRNYSVFHPIEIRTKEHPLRWTRDGWLTNGRWGSRDFFTHGWQLSRANKNFARWLSPFVPAAVGTGFDMEKCGTDRAMENWAYKDTFILRNREISKFVQEKIEKAKEHYKIVLAENENFEKGLIRDNYAFQYPFL